MITFDGKLRSIIKGNNQPDILSSMENYFIKEIQFSFVIKKIHIPRKNTFKKLILVVFSFLKTTTSKSYRWKWNTHTCIKMINHHQNKRDVYIVRKFSKKYYISRIRLLCELVNTGVVIELFRKDMSIFCDNYIQWPLMRRGQLQIVRSEITLLCYIFQSRRYTIRSWKKTSDEKTHYFYNSVNSTTTVLEKFSRCFGVVHSLIAQGQRNAD